MKHVFNITTGEHLGWIDDEPADGRNDWTEIAPPVPTNTHIGFWTGAAWELRPRPEIAAAVRKAAVDAVQAHLDATAQAWGYDSIFTACTYADEPSVPRFQAEGQALRAWRSQVWAACYASAEAVATVQDLIENLPPVPARPA